MTIRLAFAITLGLAAPLAAQELDPDAPVAPVALLGDDRMVVENGGALFDCAISFAGTTAELSDCQADPYGEVSAADLLGLDDAAWQALVRDTLLDAECRISAFGAVGVIVADAALARGVPAEVIEAQRDALAARADEIVAQMVRDGTLTYRGGELALDACG